MQSISHTLTTEERLSFASSPPSGTSMLCMGFYPTQSMWLGKRLSPIPADVVCTPECAVAMHQAIRWYGSHADYTMWITRDGLVMLALMRGLLDKEGIQPDTEEDSRRIAADPMYASMSLTAYGRKWSLYLDYLNAAHLLLAAARQRLLQSMKIKQFIGEVTLTNALVFRHFIDDPLHRSESRWCRFTWAPEDGSVTVEKHTSLECPRMHVQRASSCPVLPQEQFELLDRVDQQLSGCDAARVRLLAMVARAVHAYQETSYDTCLILIWTVIENLISKRYDALVAEQEAQSTSTSTTSRERQKTKVKGISKQIKLLHQQQRLPAGRPLLNGMSSDPPQGRFMEFIELIREARNGLVHNAKACDDGQCDKAYAVLDDLVREDWNINLPLMQSRAMINIAG